MIDAKEADKLIHGIKDGTLTFNEATSSVVANSLRGIMGELYRMRKLQEKQLEAMPGWEKPNYDVIYEVE